MALLQDGSLKLKWKCNNPANTQGTTYEVFRKVAGQGGFGYVGGSGIKEFVDDTLPAGSEGVTYQLTAVRSTKRGLPAQFNVNFGVSSSGATTASVAIEPKLAA